MTFGRLSEGAVKQLCFLAALVSVLTTAGILYVLLSDAFGFFRDVASPDKFFLGTVWQPNAFEPKYGVLPLVTGTLMITFGSLVISVPLGLFSAVYLSEYAPLKVKQILKPALELLAGVPTVVYGYFALVTVTPALRALGWNVDFQNAAAGAIVVGVMTLPLISSLCEDALAAVPRGLREAAYGLGSTKFEVTIKIVVPAALSGIVASFILAISRAIGETMAVTLASGYRPSMDWNFGASIQTMTATIVNMSKGDLDRGDPAYQAIFAVGATLFAVTLGLNLIAQQLVKRFRRVGF
jgi:phosphate transport system permease protein